MSTVERLGLLTRIPGVAGPASFQRRLRAGLEQRGVEVRFDDLDACGAVLLVGGTRQLLRLERIRRAGVPIVQRLNGFNWIHRQRATGVGHFLRAELNNLLLRWGRSRADLIVYQSEFAKRWWERSFGVARAPARVIHNGVPLDSFTPEGRGAPPADRVRVALVEGNIGGGYEIGLEWALELAQRLAASVTKPVELSVAGAVDPEVKARTKVDPAVRLRWEGVIAPDYIPAHYRSASLLFSADLHPACPNTVIEAMACGLPVLAFDTGAIAELVADGAGEVVDYGADPWRVEQPDLAALAAAAQRVIEDPSSYRGRARARAVAGFGLERMLADYLRAFEDARERIA